MLDKDRWLGRIIIDVRKNASYSVTAYPHGRIPEGIETKAVHGVDAVQREVDGFITKLYANAEEDVREVSCGEG